MITVILFIISFSLFAVSIVGALISLFGLFGVNDVDNCRSHYIPRSDLSRKKFNEDYLEGGVEYFTKKHWEYISLYQILSETFIEKYKDLVDWLYISRCQILSESFIDQNSDKVYWYCISEYQNLSENFILNNLEYININQLEHNRHISKETIEKVEFMKEI
jgi:hypothetical protein